MCIRERFWALVPMFPFCSWIKSPIYALLLRFWNQMSLALQKVLRSSLRCQPIQIVPSPESSHVLPAA